VTISVEAVIQSSVGPGDYLPTSTRTATFIVDQQDRGPIAALRPEEDEATLSWRCLEGIPDYLRGRDRQRPVQVRLTGQWPQRRDRAYLPARSARRRSADYRRDRHWPRGLMARQVKERLEATTIQARPDDLSWPYTGAGDGNRTRTVSLGS
jgi:hypothetical protein